MQSYLEVLMVEPPRRLGDTGKRRGSLKIYCKIAAQSHRFLPRFQKKGLLPYSKG